MSGVLFACMVAEDERLGSLEAWYDDDHLPGRMAIPGFLRATRYRERCAAAGVRATACLYDLAAAATLSSPAYLALQDRTAQDTADHLAGLAEMWRLAGDVVAEGEGGADAAPAPFLLAVVLLDDDDAAAPAAARTRRVRTTVADRAATLVLHDLARPPDDAELAPPRHGRAWLLERRFTVRGTSSAPG